MSLTFVISPPFVPLSQAYDDKHLLLSNYVTLLKSAPVLCTVPFTCWTPSFPKKTDKFICLSIFAEGGAGVSVV